MACSLKGGFLFTVSGTRNREKPATRAAREGRINILDNHPMKRVPSATYTRRPGISYVLWCVKLDMNETKVSLYLHWAEICGSGS